MTNVICLVTGVRKKTESGDPGGSDSRLAAFYYEGADPTTFKYGNASEKKLPYTVKSEGSFDWEGKTLGTSVCNTIRSPLWAILSC